MPDEFQLRPFYESTGLPGTSGVGKGLNNAHEQGARALAAAVVEEANANAIVHDPLTDTGHAINIGINQVLGIIHRLVPPKEKA